MKKQMFKGLKNELLVILVIVALGLAFVAFKPELTGSVVAEPDKLYLIVPNTLEDSVAIRNLVIVQDDYGDMFTTKLPRDLIPVLEESAHLELVSIYDGK